jgi:hypothetical protein
VVVDVRELVWCLFDAFYDCDLILVSSTIMKLLI